MIATSLNLRSLMEELRVSIVPSFGAGWEVAIYCDAAEPQAWGEGETLLGAVNAALDDMQEDPDMEGHLSPDVWARINGYR